MRVWLRTLPKRWFFDAMGGLGLGLMCSLVAGVILSQLARIEFLAWLAPFAEMAGAQSPVIGCAAGAAIAVMLKSKPLVIYASVISGAVGYMAGNGMGGPVGAYVGALIGAEFGNAVAGRTKLDILLVPLTVIAAGGLAGQFVGPGVGYFMTWLGSVINAATQLQPFWMGIALSVIVGMSLSSPISSAALAIALGLSGLAAGAATVGCCCNMIGFAVTSFRDNGIGGLVAQGLGTSKLQLPNIIRRPLIWAPQVAASILLGPVSTIIFKMTNNKVGAGMGTSALVGQINTFIEMTQTQSYLLVLGKMALLHVVLPALITYVIYRFMFRKGWIKPGDMKLTA